MHTKPLGPAGVLSALAVWPDGRHHTIKLWNPDSGTCEATLERHAYWVSALAVLADGRLVSGSSDNSIGIWESNQGPELASVQFIADADVTALAVVRDQFLLAAADASGRVHFLKIEGRVVAG
jgi:WD40 repeat protein